MEQTTKPTLKKDTLWGMKCASRAVAVGKILAEAKGRGEEMTRRQAAKIFQRRKGERPRLVAESR